MKTIKLISISLFLMLATSCESYQQVHTRINRNGSIEREVYADADSAFMAGNMESNPFLFIPDGSWEVTRYDSAFACVFWGKNVKFNVRAKKKFSSFESYINHTQAKEDQQPMVLPREKLQPKFRWFYTYYTYSATYESLAQQLPVPLDFYLTKDEQQILLQGDTDAFEGMNGIEQYNRLDDIAERFEQWYQQCEFKITFDALCEHISDSEDSKYTSALPTIREDLFAMAKKKNKLGNITSTLIAELLDKHFKTDFFSAFLSNYDNEVEKRIEDKARLLTLFENSLAFSIAMPGKVIETNATLRDGNSLLWKIDAYRFLAHDYVLQAQSRELNVWALALTLFLLIAGIGARYKVRR